MMAMDPTNGHGHGFGPAHGNAFSSSSFVSISSGPDGRPQVYQVIIDHFFKVMFRLNTEEIVNENLQIIGLLRDPPRT